MIMIIVGNFFKLHYLIYLQIKCDFKEKVLILKSTFVLPESICYRYVLDTRVHRAGREAYPGSNPLHAPDIGMASVYYSVWCVCNECSVPCLN